MQEQYQFIYDALLETFICGDTSIAQDLYLQRYPSLLTPSPDTGSTLLQEQFEVSSHRFEYPTTFLTYTRNMSGMNKQLVQSNFREMIELLNICLFSSNSYFLWDCDQ